jgi:hypothetical protein
LLVAEGSIQWGHKFPSHPNLLQELFYIFK